MEALTMGGNGEPKDVLKLADTQAVAAGESPRRGVTALVSHD